VRAERAKRNWGRAAARGLGGLLVAAFVALGALPAQAAQELYDYDALGRLIRVIDEQGRVTQYVYDAAGNILQVITGGTAQPPTVNSIAPASIRRGATARVTLSGNALLGATVSVSDPGLDVSGVQASATQVSFTLAVAIGATLGPQAIRLTNAAGTASASVTVNPVLPQVFVDPTPLAIPPDNTPRAITIRFSNADNIDHVLNLSMSNAKATISPSSVTIPAGQTQASATVAGISAGQATLTIASPTLGTTTLFPVFITGEFAGISTSFALPLGVTVQSNTPANQKTITPVASKNVGVVVGAFVRGVAPQTFTVGTGPNALTISGAGLQTAQSVSVIPSAGITVGAPTVSPDGTAVSVPLTIAANATISPRRVVVAGPTGPFPAAAPDVDRINVVRPAPQIASIDPIFATPGTLFTLTVRGVNLQDAQSVSFSPAAGLTAGAFPSGSADGAVLTTAVQVAASAAVGPRAVIVTTPGGSSDPTPTAANTFSVVNQAVQTVTPVVSTAVGVVLQDAAPPAPAPTTMFATQLGVTVGSIVTGISPTVGIIGTSTTLTAQGSELQGVTAVQIVPNTGLTLGTATVAADGRSVSLPVTIDIGAPQTLRTVKVLKGSIGVPFASPDAALFRVSAPPPVFDSISPIVLQVGQPPVTLTIRGRNLQNTSIVKTAPSDGVTVNNPPAVSADGTSLTVAISAAASAAPGPRAVVAVTPAGESSSVPTAQNTLTLTTAAGTSVNPVISPALGVVLQSDAPPATIAITPVASPALGVVLGDPNPPPPPSQTQYAPSVGVVIGPVALGIDPVGFAPSTTSTLTVRGVALGGTTGVSVVPSTGVTIGAFAVSPDGGVVTAPITIAADAAATIREVRLQGASGRIPFADPAASRFTIGPGVPQFDSITPIIAVQGTTFTMTIRGSNFAGATAVTATPPDGIAISSTFTVNSTGTQIDVGMSLAPNAPVGSRVIQVLVPGAASSATASPANTLNVVTP
jgi:YD repeat-containing protein